MNMPFAEWKPQATTLSMVDHQIGIFGLVMNDTDDVVLEWKYTGRYVRPFWIERDSSAAYENTQRRNKKDNSDQRTKFRQYEALLFLLIRDSADSLLMRSVWMDSR